MATIASLNVLLRAVTGNFDKNIMRSGRTVNQFSGTVGVASKALSAFGTAIGGAAIIAGFRGVTRAAAEFETQMASVNTMLTVSDERFLTKYRKALSEMAVEFGEGTATLSKGMFDIISAGINAAGAINVLNVAVKAAKGGMTDTAVAVDGLTTILNAYQLQASQAAHVSDLMFKIVKEGKITFLELSENIGKIAPTARAAGVSVQELSALIAAMVRIEKPDRAMTALRAAMLQAAGMGTNLLALIEKFRGRSLQDIIGAGINRRAATAIALLSANTRLLNKEMRVMSNVTGAAQEAFDKMAITSQTAFDRAIQAGIAIARDVGEPFMAASKSAAIWVAESQKGITQTIKWTAATAVLAVSVSGVAKAYRRLLVLIRLVSISGIGSVTQYLGWTTKLGRLTVGVTKKVKAMGAALGIVGGIGIAALAGIIGWAVKVNSELEKGKGAYEGYATAIDEMVVAFKASREAREFKGPSARGLEKTRDALTKVTSQIEALANEAKRQEALFGTFDKITGIGQAKAAAQTARDLRHKIGLLEQEEKVLKRLEEIQTGRAERDRKILSAAAAAAEKQAELFKKQSQAAKRIFEQTRTPIEKYKAQIDKLNNFLSLGIITLDTYGRAVEDALEKFDAPAIKIFEQTRTPLEQYSKKITELDELIKTGAISWDTYGRAARMARKELEGKGPGEFRTFQRGLIDVRGLGSLGAGDPKLTAAQQTNVLLEVNNDLLRRGIGAGVN